MEALRDDQVQNDFTIARHIIGTNPRILHTELRSLINKANLEEKDIMLALRLIDFSSTCNLDAEDGNIIWKHMFLRCHTPSVVMEFLRTMLPRCEVPKTFRSDLDHLCDLPEYQALVLGGIALRRNLPEYFGKRSHGLDTELSSLKLPNVLRGMIDSMDSGNFTTEELWATGLGQVDQNVFLAALHAENYFEPKVHFHFRYIHSE
jgi:hypothetical protein